MVYHIFIKITSTYSIILRFFILNKRNNSYGLKLCAVMSSFNLESVKYNVLVKAGGF